MSATPRCNPWSRRASARVTIPVVVGLAIAAVGGAVLAWVLLLRGGDGQTIEPTTMTQAAIDADLATLQEDFKTALQEKRDLTRVLARTKRFTEQHPDQLAGHILLAQTQMREQRWGPAYASWTRALELGPGVYEQYKMAGFCAARLDRLEQALGHYQDAVDAAGDRADYEVFASIGRLHLAMDNPDAAEQAFTRALNAPGTGDKTNWKHPGYAGLANVAAVRGEFEQAHQHIDRAIKLANLDSNADLVGYHLQKARLYLDADQPDNALAMLTTTWQQFDDAQERIESARLRAALYERADQTDKAVTHIAYVCDLHQRDPDRKDPVLAEFYALLAKWQLKAGQTQNARTSISNLRTLAPDHPDLAELKQELP